MNGDEVVEFEFGYETPFVVEMSETRQHFYFFFAFFCFASFAFAVLPVRPGSAKKTNRSNGSTKNDD
jgi:hypothetical protein